MKNLPNIFFLQMNGGHNYMAGWLFYKLYNSFSQIRIYNFISFVFEIMIKTQFFGQNRLALYHVLNVVLLKNSQNMLIMLLCIFRPYNLRSEEHTSELQSRENLVCRLLLEKKNYRTA